MSLGKIITHFLKRFGFFMYKILEESIQNPSYNHITQH